MGTQPRTGSRAATRTMVAFAWAATLAQAATALAIGSGVDALIGGPDSGTPPVRHIAIPLALAVAAGALTVVPLALGARNQVRVETGWRQLILDQLVRLGLADRDDKRTGRVVSSATDGVERAGAHQGGFSATIIAALSGTLLVLAVVALAIDPVAALWLTIGVVVAPLLIGWFHRVFKSVSGRYRAEARHVSAAFLDAIQSLGSLSLARADGRATESLAAGAQSLRRRVMRMLAGNQLVMLGVDTILTLALPITALICALAGVRSGTITGGQAIALVLLSVIMLESIDRVAQFFYIAMGGMAAVREIRRYLARTPKPRPAPPAVRPGHAAEATNAPAATGHIPPVPDAAPHAGTSMSPRAAPRPSAASPEATAVTTHPRATPAAQPAHAAAEPASSPTPAGTSTPAATLTPAPSVDAASPEVTAVTTHPRATPAAQPAHAAALRPGAASERGATASGPVIEFDHVDFSYGDNPVLRGASFAVARGEHVALVGPSGAGKSTIAALVVGERYAAGGQVRVDGADVARAPESWARSRCAVVSQRTYLFTGTIRDNLLLARPDASDDDLARALDAAELTDFIRERGGTGGDLATGLQTLVGERGMSLSGGQAARVAIARAMLRDAPILILDEPTANVDLHSEAAIMRGLARLATGRTVVTISHRATTTAYADRILAVHGGQVTQLPAHNSDAVRPDPAGCPPGAPIAVAQLDHQTGASPGARAALEPDAPTHRAATCPPDVSRPARASTATQSDRTPQPDRRPEERQSERTPQPDRRLEEPQPERSRPRATSAPASIEVSR